MKAYIFNTVGPEQFLESLSYGIWSNIKYAISFFSVRDSFDKLMQELKDAEPKFQSAYTELTTAVEALVKGDYQSAINNAGKSYESILKVILGADRGNADKLTNQYMDQLLSVPDTMTKAGFREKVMMSLPYVRNHSGADHGAGAKEVVITKPMAKLAVNLAAALDTYLIEEYAESNRGTW